MAQIPKHLKSCNNFQSILCKKIKTMQEVVPTARSANTNCYSYTTLSCPIKCVSILLTSRLFDLELR